MSQLATVFTHLTSSVQDISIPAKTLSGFQFPGDSDIWCMWSKTKWICQRQTIWQVENEMEAESVTNWDMEKKTRHGWVIIETAWVCVLRKNTKERQRKLLCDREKLRKTVSRQPQQEGFHQWYEKVNQGDELWQKIFYCTLKGLGPFYLFTFLLCKVQILILILWSSQSFNL